MESTVIENNPNERTNVEASASNDVTVSESQDEKSKDKKVVYLYAVKDATEALTGLRLIGSEEMCDAQQKVKIDHNTEADAVTVFPCMTNLSCSTCSSFFENRNDYVDHVRGDFHRFNVRAKLRGLAIVSEEKFEEMTGDISSISGSDSEGSDEVDDPSSLGFNPRAVGQNEDEFMNACSRQLKIFLRNGKGEAISVHRCLIFGKKSNLSSSANVLHAVENLPSCQKVAIFMVGGGHFAGAVFDGEKIVQHKTFHRYVVRAKRGTVQSQRDKQGNAPRSAGAALRRYNESALTKEIQELIASWSADLKACTKIFLRAPGFNNAIFFGGKSPVFDKSETRIYPISFATRRPTFRELKRVHKSLCTIEVFNPDCPISECISPKKVQKILVETESSNVSETVVDKSGEPQRQGHLGQEESTHAESGRQKDVSSDDFSEPEACELVWSTVSFDTSELKEFENPKRRPARKKKTKETIKIKDKEENVQEIVQLNGDQLELRNSLFTACKTGDLGHFQSSFRNLEELLRKEMTCTEGTGAPETFDGCAVSSEGHDDLETSCTDAPLLKNCPDFEQRLSKFLSLRFGPQLTTLLHVATHTGNKQMINLLMTAGADPSVRDKQNQVPFLVATTKDTKNEFRRFMAQNPMKYDYVKAQIPGPLTEEMENDRKAKANEKKKFQRKTKKEKIKENQLQEEKKKVEEESRQKFLAMSDREKRAFAAEQRFKMQLERENSAKTVITSRCWECGHDLTGRIPFEYYDFKFCSPSCLGSHRQKNFSN